MTTICDLKSAQNIKRVLWLESKSEAKLHITHYMIFFKISIMTGHILLSIYLSSSRL